LPPDTIQDPDTEAPDPWTPPTDPQPTGEPEPMIPNPDIEEPIEPRPETADIKDPPNHLN
jgi:hypothetical protein